MKSLSGSKAFFTYDPFLNAPGQSEAGSPYMTTLRDQFEVDYAGYPDILKQGLEASLPTIVRAEAPISPHKPIGKTAVASLLDRVA